MTLRLLLPLLFCLFLPHGAAAQALLPEDPAIRDPYTGWVQKQERVVIVHDLFEMPVATATLARAFRDAGYKTDNLGYNPLSADKQAVFPAMLRNMGERLRHYDGDTVHFACHAFGCVLAHALIARHRPARLGRVVMLVAPWQAPWIRDPEMKWLAPLLENDRLDGANRHLALQLLDEPQRYEAAALTGDRQIYPQRTQPMLQKGSTHTAHLPALAHPLPLLVADADQDSLITDPAVLAQAVHYIAHGRFATQ